MQKMWVQNHTWNYAHVIEITTRAREHFGKPLCVNSSSPDSQVQVRLCKEKHPETPPTSLGPSSSEMD